MIIIKDVPGVELADIVASVADRIPTSEIKTGYGGVVVDERTALIFLQRYFAAIEPAAEPAVSEATTEVRTEPAAIDVEPEMVTTPTPTSRRRGARTR